VVEHLARDGILAARRLDRNHIDIRQLERYTDILHAVVGLIGLQLENKRVFATFIQENRVWERLQMGDPTEVNRVVIGHEINRSVRTVILSD
jgi:hypothetical protein